MRAVRTHTHNAEQCRGCEFEPHLEQPLSLATPHKVAFKASEFPIHTSNDCTHLLQLLAVYDLPGETFNMAHLTVCACTCSRPCVIQ